MEQIKNEEGDSLTHRSLEEWRSTPIRQVGDGDLAMATGEQGRTGGQCSAGWRLGDGCLPAAGGRRAGKPGRVAPSLRGWSSDGSREAGRWELVTSGCSSQAAARHRRADSGVADGSACESWAARQGSLRVASRGGDVADAVCRACGVSCVRVGQSIGQVLDWAVVGLGHIHQSRYANPETDTYQLSVSDFLKNN